MFLSIPKVSLAKPENWQTRTLKPNLRLEVSLNAAKNKQTDNIPLKHKILAQQIFGI